MEAISDYLERVHLETLAAVRTERENRFAFMLPVTVGTGWITECRYRTKEQLDAAVRTFAEEFKDDNDGFATVSGKDFMAVEMQDYDISDEEKTLTRDDILDARGEFEREDALFL